MTQRVKSDKEYSSLLLSMTQHTEKPEAADYISTVSKVSSLGTGLSLFEEPVSSGLCFSVLVSGSSSDGSVGSSDEESR